MKIPPKKPQFLKPIHKGFKHGLKIPIGFLKYLKGHEQHEHAILRSVGKTWLVKVNGWRLEEGWKKFAKENDLQLGDMLVFRHEGDMEFEVSIFDSSHCDREYAEYLQQEAGFNNVEETCKKFEFKGKSNLCIMSSGEALPYAEAGTYSPCSRSHFECIVKPYCITHSYLRLPKHFAMENGIFNKKCDVIIRDERQRSWKLRLATHDCRVHLLGGWSEFRIANDLNVGDYMMFEVIANGEKPIWKFRDKPNANIVSTRKAFPKEEFATCSSFSQSHVECIVRPYCLKRNYYRLPRGFARANGLINNKCGLVIRDERQRSWNLRIDTYGYGVYIAKGWRKFRAENDLKQGDRMMFEVVSNGEKPIWKYNATNTNKNKNKNKNKPFAQSHFVCIIRPYCLINDFLYIPTKIAHAYRLTNKKCDLVIRDDRRERSWNVKLRSFGNSVCIKGGWREFRDANCLKEGDCIMFEVVSNGENTTWKYNGKISTKDHKKPIDKDNVKKLVMGKH
ncbi:B3 domain-containing protein REM17-like isoform X1 [Solanum pennellii]|uniref:B3 domain-containing protein REM17-like isoform X1 n=1 Tax=Solanum pennellii TaxID=28526 RepID=A0ABM1HG15_SOLPN|nr:B3 domain-containing protein REM17-like isoform X1 [Solanum pennellii]